MGTKCILALSVLITLSSACTRPLITIATNLPEVVDYIEFVRDNITPPQFKIIYDINPDRSVVLKDISPDIIISDRMAHENFSNYLYDIPISRLNSKQSGRNSDDFVFEDIYPGSYAPYVRNNSLTIVPLAFNLPIVYMTDEFVNGQEIESLLNSEQLLDRAEDHTVLRRDIYSVMGFSSIRNPLFIDLLIREHTGQRGMIPSIDRLETAMEDIIGLLNEKEQTPFAQLYFNEVFAYSYDRSSMLEGNLHASLDSFYAHNTSVDSRTFPYAWLYSAENIEAFDLVYIGISSSSRYKSQGIEILRRLLSARVQTQYLQKLLASKRLIKGFLFRMSSNRLVNKYVISQFVDNNSVPENIVFPERPSFLWTEIKQEVYYPWIIDTILSNEISTDDLYQRLDSYYRLNSGYQ